MGDGPRHGEKLYKGERWGTICKEQQVGHNHKTWEHVEENNAKGEQKGKKGPSNEELEITKNNMKEGHYLNAFTKTNDDNLGILFSFKNFLNCYLLFLHHLYFQQFSSPPPRAVSHNNKPSRKDPLTYSFPLPSPLLQNYSTHTWSLTATADSMWNDPSLQRREEGTFSHFFSNYNDKLSYHNTTFNFGYLFFPFTLFWSLYTLPSWLIWRHSASFHVSLPMLL